MEEEQAPAQAQPRKFLTKAALKNSTDSRATRFATVMVPGFDEPLRIRSLSDKEYSYLQSKAVKASGQIDKVELQVQNARMIQAVSVDGEGNKLFSEDDIRWLRELDSAITEPLVAKIREHLGIIDETTAKN